MNRLFVFGCSFTSYMYPTWADFLGENFEEYYNYGLGGACNQTIFSKFVEADNLHNFNNNDYIVIMLSSIDRFSFYNDDKWKRIMDYKSNDKLMDCFLNDMYSNSWGLYKTFTFTKIIHDILNLKKIKHKIVKAFPINFENIQNDSKFTNFSISKKYLKYITNVTNNNESLSEFINRCYPEIGNYYSYDKIIDGHPTIEMHYQYFKKWFPDYFNDKTDILYNISTNFMDTNPTQKKIIEFFNKNIFLMRKNNNLDFF